MTDEKTQAGNCYVLHLPFTAESDGMALLQAATMVHRASAVCSAHLHLGRAGHPHVTDADDYAEQVTGHCAWAALAAPDSELHVRLARQGCGGEVGRAGVGHRICEWHSETYYRWLEERRAEQEEEQGLDGRRLTKGDHRDARVLRDVSAALRAMYAAGEMPPGRLQVVVGEGVLPSVTTIYGHPVCHGGTGAMQGRARLFSVNLGRYVGPGEEQTEAKEPEYAESQMLLDSKTVPGEPMSVQAPTPGSGPTSEIPLVVLTRDTLLGRDARTGAADVRMLDGAAVRCEATADVETGMAEVVTRAAMHLWCAKRIRTRYPNAPFKHSREWHTSRYHALCTALVQMGWRDTLSDIGAALRVVVAEWCEVAGVDPRDVLEPLT